MGQLERRFGRQDAARRVSELHAVWVSHMHADHHGGLYPLLARRAAMGCGPLLVIGPWPLWRVLMAYAKVRAHSRARSRAGVSPQCHWWLLVSAPLSSPCCMGAARRCPCRGRLCFAIGLLCRPAL